MDNVVNRASSRSSSTTNQCAFLSAIACASPNRSAGSRSYRSAGNGTASYGCQTEHQKADYRRYYLCFHLLPPLDVMRDSRSFSEGSSSPLVSGGRIRLLLLHRQGG